MDKNYKGLIWTNHALTRMRKRGIKQGDVWATFNRPDQSKKARIKGAWVYYKTWDNERIEVVAKQNEKKQWVILSVWSRLVYEKSAKKADTLWKLIKKRVFKKKNKKK